MNLCNLKKFFLSVLAVASVTTAVNMNPALASEKSAAPAPAKPAASSEEPNLRAYLPVDADIYFYINNDLLDMFLSENTIKTLSQLNPQKSIHLNKQKAQTAASITLKKGNKDSVSVLAYIMGYNKDTAMTDQMFSKDSLKFLPKDIKQTSEKFEGKDAIVFNALIQELAKNVKGRIVKENANLVSSVIAFGCELPAKGPDNTGKKVKAFSDDVLFQNTVIAKNIIDKFGNDLQKDLEAPLKTLVNKLEFVQTTISQKDKKYYLAVAVNFRDEASAKLQAEEFQKQGILNMIKEDPSLQAILPDISAKADGTVFNIKSTINAEALKTTVDTFVMLFSDSAAAMFKEMTQNASNDNSITVEKETVTAPAKAK